MITRVKGLKISQVPELKEITGEEMIPYQYKCTNGKISASTLASYISENLDPNDPTGEIGQLREDVDNLTDRVDKVEDNVSSIEDQVNANTTDIKDIQDLIDSGTIGGGDADYVKKLLDEFKATKGQPDGLASLDSEGKLEQDQLPDNVVNVEGFQAITYSQLKSKVDNGQLEPGVKYGITDYSCIYILPQYETEDQVEVEQPATDFKYIICTALNNNTLSDDVEIIREKGKYKIISAKYNIDPQFCKWTRDMTTKQPKGVIYYLEDENHNAATYDFKHIKFRRWAVTNIGPNTTVDTGSNDNTSPYRCYVTSTFRTLSDNRQLCGSSDPIEKTLVPAIFNGTWRCGGEDSPRFPTLKTNNGIAMQLTPFHEDYIKRELKPYTDTNYPSDKYLAWQTDMYAPGGLAAKGQISSSAPHMTGQCNVTVDSDDYMDRYTFDYNGQDASEMTINNASGIIPLVSATKILNNNTAIDYIALPNTVIAISQSIKDNTPTDRTPAAYVCDNIFTGSISRNTILLNKANPKSATAQFSRNRFGEGGVQIAANLIIVNYLFNRCKIVEATYNYINGAMNLFTIRRMALNVIFGYYTETSGLTLQNCLWFGNNAYTKLTNSDWKSSSDGEYWYANNFEGNFYSNIMAPCQYCSFEPHFNSNLFKGVYNKGVYVQGSNQLCSYAWNAWGVNIGYGIGQGIMFGPLVHTTIPTIAFSGVGAENTTVIGGVAMMKEENVGKEPPGLYETDIVSTYPSDPYTIKNTVPSTEHYPSSKDRHILYVSSDGNWKLTNWKNVLDGATTYELHSDEEPLSLEDYAMLHNKEYPDYNVNPELPYDDAENIVS